MKVNPSFWKAFVLYDIKQTCTSVPATANTMWTSFNEQTHKKVFKQRIWISLSCTRQGSFEAVQCCDSSSPTDQSLACCCCCHHLLKKNGKLTYSIHRKFVHLGKAHDRVPKATLAQRRQLSLPNKTPSGSTLTFWLIRSLTRLQSCVLPFLVFPVYTRPADAAWAEEKERILGGLLILCTQ